MAQAAHELVQLLRASWRRWATLSVLMREWALQTAAPDSEALVFPDNTANIIVKYGYFDRERAKVHHLPVLISDNGRPSLTGTSMLHVTVCKCNEQGEFTLCEEVAAQAGISVQALVAIFLCILTITGQCPEGWEGTVRGLQGRRRGQGSRPNPAAFSPKCGPVPGVRSTSLGAAGWEWMTGEEEVRLKTPSPV